MKRREFLILVASGGSVFAPPLAGGDDHPFDGATDSGEAGSDETDGKTSSPHEATPETDDESETVELTIELY